MNQLFADLKTDEEKSSFFLSGRGYETGVIAAAIQNDVAMAYHRCAEYRKENAALSAVVERQREALKKVIAISDRKHEAWDEAKEALSLTPATALRLHDAEVLEQLRNELRELSLVDFYQKLAEKISSLRAGGEG